MEDEVLKNTAEAIGIAEEESGQNAGETLKAFAFRASDQLYVALREIIPEGSLSAGLRIGVCAWYGLFYCRLCGDRLKDDRPTRVVDRWCEECYGIITSEDVRGMIEATLPEGSVPARSERTPDPWPDWVYEPVTDKKVDAKRFRHRQENRIEAKAWRKRKAELAAAATEEKTAE